MSCKTGQITLELTLEEALELFSLCLTSTEADTPMGNSALRKLGQAIESTVGPAKRAS